MKQEKDVFSSKLKLIQEDVAALKSGMRRLNTLGQTQKLMDENLALFSNDIES